MEPPKQPKVIPKNVEGFSSLRDILIKNIEFRDKPIEKVIPTEAIKIIKSDAMKNMVEAMNKYYVEFRDLLSFAIFGGYTFNTI